MNQLLILPPAASEQARYVDLIYYVLVGASAIVSLAVLITGITFAVRYRRGSTRVRRDLPEWISRDFEIGWTVATLFTFVFFFWFAGSAFLQEYKAPPNALEIHVVGKQWMWKIEHPNGAREINEIHVPVGVPVRLVMTSQDVIHSFFLPALRLKRDVLPNRYSEFSFNADTTGIYNMFCAEYCGADHAQMIGRLVLQSPSEYEQWAESQSGLTDLAGEGRELFTRLGCSGCHGQSDNVKAPNLAGLFGSYVKLADGQTVRADQAYLHDSIMLPQKQVVAGYDPIMPSYQGTVSEDQLFKIMAYLKTLSGDEEK